MQEHVLPKGEVDKICQDLYRYLPKLSDQQFQELLAQIARLREEAVNADWRVFGFDPDRRPPIAGYAIDFGYNLVVEGQWEQARGLVRDVYGHQNSQPRPKEERAGGEGGARANPRIEEVRRSLESLRSRVSGLRYADLLASIEEFLHGLIPTRAL